MNSIANRLSLFLCLWGLLLSAEQNELHSFFNRLDRNKPGSKRTVGNQWSFHSVAPVTINSLDIIYYSDTGCFTQESTTNLAGPASVTGDTTYTSSDAANLALCTKYAGGCSALYNATTGMAPTVKAMRFRFNYDSGVSQSSDCLINFGEGKEVLADYTDPESPIACSNGNPCGFSKSYRLVDLNLPAMQNGNGNFACLLRTDGAIHCWGSGGAGEIGDGQGTNVNIPTAVTMPAGVTDFSMLSSNHNSSCALAGAGANSGRIYCWGYAESGQIGNGSDSSTYIPTGVTMPAGVSTFSLFSTSAQFACATAGSGVNAGNLYCWGNGTNWQMGNNDTQSKNVPTLVTMPGAVTSFKALALSDEFGCAIAGSGTDAGKVFCWGDISSGQIGNGESDGEPVPTSVTMPAGVSSFSEISAGINWVCAIADEGANAGKIYCWGSGTSGKIGNGADANVSVPTSVTMPSGVSKFKSLTLGNNFSCAIADGGAHSGTVYCWGSGSNGRLGNGATSSQNVPVSVTMPGAVDTFSSVSAGVNSACAIAESGTDAGKIYCWGNGSQGQIGNGANSQQLTPTLTTLPAGVTAFGSILVKSTLACSIAGTGANAGKVYCWGSGTIGTIGNGANSNVNVPTATSRAF